jgi:ATP-binding cassette subfamily B protein
MHTNILDKQKFSETLLYKSIVSCKKAFWFIFFFSCAINILVMFMPIYTMQILDRVVTSGSVDTLILLTIITFVATVGMISLEGCRTLAIQKIGEWLEKIMSDELIGRGLALTIQNPGTSGSQILRDMSTIRNFVSSNALIALFDIPWAVMFFVLMLMINSTIAFIAFIGIILVVLLAVFNEFATSKNLKIINETQVKNYNEIEAAIRNAEVVESMGMGDAITRMWKRKNSAVAEMQHRSSILGTIINSISKLLRTVLNTFILAGGIYISLSNHTTVGGILACSMLMGRVMAPIDIIISSSKMISGARTSYSRLQGMLVNMQLRNSAMELPPPLGKVTANQVIYAPAGGQRSTLKGVSFDINPGECVGVIGPSGCGKSTLMKLIVGVWKPGNGAIRLDGADVYTWNRSHFGKYVGYLPQDIELFNVSIKSNISRLSDEIDPMLVVLAAKIAGVHELILSLPNGYDTVIGYGAGAVMLSGGQKQRIALARAFYGDMRLIVLDEPNSNLDQQGEQSLMNAIHIAKQQKKTVIFTTHKMNLLALTDKILVMQDGVVSAFGPRDEILSQMVANANQQQQQKAQSDSGASAKQQVSEQQVDDQQDNSSKKDEKDGDKEENQDDKNGNDKSDSVSEKSKEKETFKPSFGFGN